VSITPFSFTHSGPFVVWNDILLYNLVAEFEKVGPAVAWFNGANFDIEIGQFHSIGSSDISLAAHLEARYKPAPAKPLQAAALEMFATHTGSSGSHIWNNGSVTFNIPKTLMPN